MWYTLPHLMTPFTGTLFSPFPEPVFQRAEQSCENRRPQLSAAMAEPRLLRKKKAEPRTHVVSAQRGSSIPTGFFQNNDYICTSKSSNQAKKPRRTGASRRSMSCTKRWRPAISVKLPTHLFDPYLVQAHQPTLLQTIAHHVGSLSISCPLIDHTLHQLRQNAARWQRNFWVAAIDFNEE